MIDAEAAKKITTEALAPEATLIKPYLDHIESKIRTAAKDGKREIAHPFAGRPDGLAMVSSSIERAVRKALESSGFCWTDNPNPDPGHPSSSAYTSISW